MNEPLSKIPDGMRYYFGAEARLRRAVEDTIMRVFDGWSYEEIVTPSVDYLALFERGMGRDAAQQTFRFTDRDGRLLALRPDVTSSVARAAATLFAPRGRPLRLCYAASVFRHQSRSHADWRRESSQLGCELIGPAAGDAEIETLAMAAEIFARLGLQGRYRITLSSVEVFNGVAERLDLDAGERETLRHLIDVRDAAEVRRFLRSTATPARDCDAFSGLVQLPGKREVLDAARRIVTNGRSVRALDALDRLWRVFEELSLSHAFEIDLGDVSGLDYYTGLTFKMYVEGAGSRVGGGGRYDGLTANFGRAEPAIGFVLDLNALTEILARDGSCTAPADSGPRPARILGQGAAAAFREARRLRERGERVAVELGGGGDA
ncbi:MAG TPA: ATP phosphoribosyltransferase regulatory subunit [Pyrinomonadaceae bacterium]|nr:ATP phosphoribosyltransferase regulatory subunit [Pyrinomonadaceae bacterium]